MKLLYIVRHAHAGQHGDPRYPDDRLRPLTSRGRKQFRRLAKKLARRDFAPALIATSPLVRCRQTAELVAEQLEPEPELIVHEALEPGSRLSALVEWSNAQDAGATAWVGHAPDVEELAATLIGDMQARIRFAKGSVAAIECTPGESGFGTLLWLASAKLLGV